MTTLTAEQSALVHATRLAFQRSRTKPRTWLSHREQGRIDARNVWRDTATTRPDIFRERIVPGATAVNLTILVDGSGSMTHKDKAAATYNEEVRRAQKLAPTLKNAAIMAARADLQNSTEPSRVEHAARVTATLVEAVGQMAGVRLNVWLHNTMAADGSDIAMYPIIHEGRGKENLLLMPSLSGGGNGDAYAIQYLAEAMAHSRRANEVDLLIVVSDGLPSWMADSGDIMARQQAVTQSGRTNTEEPHVREVVDDARRAGVHVLSVGIAPEATGESQAFMYGHDNVVPFTGDWPRLAADFGKAAGSILAAASDEKRRSHRR